jgi:acetyltransferase
MDNHERSTKYRDVGPLLRPHSITIVGASERPDSWSARIFDNLKNYGFAGEVYLVNPRHRELYGAPCSPSVTEVPGAIDQLVVIVPAAHVPGILDEAGKRGARSAVVFSGGFSEANTPAGRAAEAEMIEAAERHGILIGGPNCLGNVSTRERVLTLAQQGVEAFKAGGLALLSQSSGLMGNVARSAHSRGIGLSYAIASGSEANVDAADYLNYLVDDPSTCVLGLILEAIRRPQEFAAACERARAGQKPIMILKIGRSKGGQTAALSHTGALSGSYEAFAAFCRRYGLIEIKGLDELVDATELFLCCRSSAATGVAALALSGGARGYLHDLGEELGIDFPELTPEATNRLEELLGVGAGCGNPLDLGAGGAGNPDLQLRCLELLATHPAIGLIAVQGELPHSPSFAKRAQGYQRMIQSAGQLGKPIVFFSHGSYAVTDYGAHFRESSGAPFLQEIRRSFQAISHFMDYQRRLESGRTGGRPIEFRPGRKPRGPVEPLTDEEAFLLLQQAGIAVARYEVCDTTEAAQRAAEALGYPVALKLSVRGLTHKSETGGIALGLSDPSEVARAFGAIKDQGSRYAGSTVRLLVQQMVQSPFELYVGAKWDPEFGPLVLFGFGGIFVEALGRVSTRLAPVEAYEAEAMVVESGVERALRRLGPTRPEVSGPILDAIVRVSQLIAARPEIEVLEINPLLFRGEGQSCVSVDVVVLKKRDRRASDSYEQK